MTGPTSEASRSSLFALLSRVYGAFNARDIEQALAALHPDVNWPNGMTGDSVHGREAVRDYWTNQWRQIDPRVEPTRMTSDDGGRIVVDVHQVVRDLSGALLVDRMVQHVYTVDDGLITQMEIRE
jgi:ketosteroid isomerase-like protein